MSDDLDGDGIPDECPDVEPEPTWFRRGNVNGDLLLDIADAVWIINELFRNGRTSPCRAASDVDGDRSIDVTDIVVLTRYLFLGGVAPAAPFPDCGRLVSHEDDLGCETADPLCR